MADNTETPFVTVLTPVYNGEEYLAECIDSVLAQDYSNWEYVIVNNRSTDGTLKLAESYAKKDSRIRVTTNAKFVSMPENFNHAFSQVSDRSQYCKIVCADDWLMPDCMSKMVRFGRVHPAVGIIGCHQQSGDKVRWRDLPPEVSVLPGREACRRALLTGVRIFGAPTAFLYRSDLMRMGKPFFPNLQPYSDTSACYEFLQYCDFGIVHELLAVERVHPDQITSKVEKLSSGTLGYIDVFLHYGPIYLSDAEFQARKKEVFDEYYRFLGGCALKLKNREFWSFQASRLREMGCELDWSRIAGGASQEVIAELRNPRAAIGKVGAVVKGKLRGD